MYTQRNPKIFPVTDTCILKKRVFEDSVLQWFVCLDGFDVTINRKLEGAGTPHARYVSITAQVCKQLCEDIHRFVHCGGA